MAGSRAHKYGSIFKRVQGLMKAEGMLQNDRPLWYDVWERFPPKVSPSYERPEPTETVKPIFYPEDLVRAKYYEEFSNRDCINIRPRADESKTKPQMFIDEYIKCQRPGASADEIFKEVEEIMAERGKKYIRIKRPSYDEPNPILQYDEKDSAI